MYLFLTYIITTHTTLIMGFDTRFANESYGNKVCCDPGCGVPKKLLCLKNGKFVKDGYKCRKVPNHGTCNPCKCLPCKSKPCKPKRKPCKPKKCGC